MDKNTDAMDFPAVNGRTVTQGHANYCATNGHATHRLNGNVSPFCPRCGADVNRITRRNG